MKLLAFIAALLVSMPAAAMSCGGQQSVKQAYSAAKDVFSAHVEETYVASGFGRDDFQFARLRILQVWKGRLNPGDVVSTTAEDTISFVSDGFVPRQGSNVLVYSDGAQPFALGKTGVRVHFQRQAPETLCRRNTKPKPLRGSIQSRMAQGHTV